MKPRLPGLSAFSSRLMYLLLIFVLVVLGPSANAAVADLNDDGLVGFPDILLLLTSFGRAVTDPAVPSAADLDADGRIGFNDFLLYLPLFSNGVAEAAGRVAVRPQETFAEIHNPGRGWVTYNGTNSRFDADPVGSTAYYRYYWKDLEPARGVLELRSMEEAIRLAVLDDQRFGFRVMSIDPSGNGIPDWLLQAPYEAVHDIGLHLQNAEREYVIPDHNDPAFLSEVERFYASLSESLSEKGLLRHLQFVDIGMVGIHGEWYLNWDDSPTHWDYLPTQASTRRIIDAVRLAFPDAACFLSLGSKNAGVQGDSTNALTYARDVGVGWRQDAWINPGNPAFPWFEGNQEILDRFVPDLWKNAPAMLESAFIMRDWGTEKIPMTEAELEDAVDWVFRNHVSLLDDTGNAVAQWIRETEAFQKLLTHMGYRLVLRSLSHSESLSRKESLDFRMSWENVGSAPPYKPWQVAVRLTSADADVTLLTGVDVSGWMPSDYRVDQGEDPEESRGVSLFLPSDVLPGTYALSIGIVDTSSVEPAVRLAIEGGDADGWYPLSEVEITD